MWRWLQSIEEWLDSTRAWIWIACALLFAAVVFLMFNNPLSPSKALQLDQTTQSEGAANKVAQNGLLDRLEDLEAHMGGQTEWSPGLRMLERMNDMRDRVAGLEDAPGDIHGEFNIASNARFVLTEGYRRLKDAADGTEDRLIWLEETVAALQAQVGEMQEREEEKP